MDNGPYSVTEVFRYLDKVGDGKIAVDQVGDCLRSMGLCPTEAEIGRLTAQWNNNKEHRVTIEDFKPILTEIKKSTKPISAERFMECLGYFDREGNGVVNAHELRYLLTAVGEKMNDEDVDFLMRKHEDGRGNIVIADFVSMVMENDAMSGDSSTR